MIQGFTMTCTVRCAECPSAVKFSVENESIYMTTVEQDLRNLKWSVGKKVICPRCQGITRQTTYAYEVTEGPATASQVREMAQEGENHEPEDDEPVQGTVQGVLG